MRTVVITGAGGYIGRHAVTAFCNSDWIVKVIERKHGEWPDGVEQISVDIFNENIDVYERLGRPDLCVHLAWQDGFSHNAQSHIQNLPLHFGFAQKLIDSGIPKLAIMGTMHEVGYWEGAVDENTPCNPLSLYGVAKNALRQSVSLYAKDKETKVYWLRGFYLTGQDDMNHSVFSKLLEKERQGETYFPFTTGKSKYDFMDVQDFCASMVKVLSQDKVTGIINICSGHPVSLREKVESFLAENHMRIQLKYGAYPDRAYDSPAIWGDRAKLAEALQAAEEDMF